MAEKKAASKFLETRYFGLVIGVLVFLLLYAFSSGTTLVKSLEQKMLDFNFRYRITSSETRIQEGVSQVQSNPRISPDILIVGIDNKSLDRFGRWPFPRYRHADLMNAYSRIKNQGDRERALFVDVFFSEPSEVPEDDALLVSSIKENSRVFLETVLSPGPNVPESDAEFFGREDVLTSRIGSIMNIKGDWLNVTTFYGLDAPLLKPYAAAVYGYGHANFLPDDDKIFRRQPLVVKLSHLEKEIPLDELTTAEPIDRSNFERLSWIDKNNGIHEIAYPLTAVVLASLKQQMTASAPLKMVEATDNAPAKSYYVVRKYKDTFIPSITLSLALEYMNKKMSDLEVVLGEYIRIQNPEKFNVDTQQWEKYTLTVTPPQMDKDGKTVKPAVTRTLSEVIIPIDATGAMLINFMGGPSLAEGHQTYPVRSYSGYAGNPPPPDPARWPATKKLGNVIVMVGPFTEGMAADQKPTPFGLMFGVEMHANALNTILMGNFLHYAPPVINALLLFLVVMLVSLMVSRLSTIWSLVVTLAAIIVYFFAYMFIFDLNSYILTFSASAIGAFLAFLAVVAYRTIFEERDKRRITNIFGKMVGPVIMKEMIDAGVDPELGGVDKYITVFFSDIRGFTSMSERMPSQTLVHHLNQYLTAMTDLILDYNGTLDKYVGDEIMCFWGAPLPEPDHALLACKCALKQMEVLAKMNVDWEDPEKRLDIGIGINTGTMTVGYMGSPGRMNYTAMGDEVNLGARLEGTNKGYVEETAQHYSKIIISEYTYNLVKDKVVARELDNLRVKGKAKPVLIYELVDIPEGLEPPTKAK
ncbi:MAG: CHASE2 domain-containing protein [Spirochaetia bacterium]|jgi:adenylate cyclase